MHTRCRYVGREAASEAGAGADAAVADGPALATAERRACAVYEVGPPRRAPPRGGRAPRPGRPARPRLAVGAAGLWLGPAAASSWPSRLKLSGHLTAGSFFNSIISYKGRMSSIRSVRRVASRKNFFSFGPLTAWLFSGTPKCKIRLVPSWCSLLFTSSLISAARALSSLSV